MKSSLVGAAVGTLGLLGSRAGQAGETGRHQIKMAGYDYDRVSAIMDGQVDVEGSDISFDVKTIYETSRYAFGPDRKYDVTEIGLIPFIRKYINEDFRSYTLILTKGLSRFSLTLWRIDDPKMGQTYLVITLSRNENVSHS